MLYTRVGPALVSRKIYIEQLVVHLRDKTCLELSLQFQAMTGITGTELVSQKELVSLMHSDFQNFVRRFRNSPGLNSALYNMGKIQISVRNTKFLPCWLVGEQHKPSTISDLKIRPVMSQWQQLYLWEIISGLFEIICGLFLGLFLDYLILAVDYLSDFF